MTADAVDASLAAPSIASWRPTAVIGRVLGITQGESATMVVLLSLAITLTAVGLPPVLRHPSLPQAGVGNQQAAASPSSQRPAESEQDPPPPPEFDRPAGTEIGPPTAVPGPGGGVGPGHVDNGPHLSPPSTGSVARLASVGDPGAPHGLAVAEDGTIYVATNNGTTQGGAGPSKILTFDQAGVPGRHYVIEGQPPDHAEGLTGLVLDGEGAIFALDASTGRVLRVDLGSGAQRVQARLLDLPPCGLLATGACEPSPLDGAPRPSGAALDGDGNLYVGDSGQGVIWKVPVDGGAARPWFSSLDLATGQGIDSLTIDPEGHVLFTSPRSLVASNAGGAGLYRVAVREDGSAGGAQLVASLGIGSGPSGVTTGRDGSIVVALREAGAVVLLTPSGEEVRRVTGSDPALAGPTGVAFSGDVLLATDQDSDSNLGFVVIVGLR